jgi:sigma-B regulation protein RsbU (phosphoserine phosphatase)
VSWILIILLLIGSGALGWLLWQANREIRWLRSRTADRDRERETVFRFLNEFGELITKKFELGETLEMVLAFSREATRADAGAIYLRDKEEPDVMQARVVQGLFPPLHEVATDKLISRRKYLADYVKKERLSAKEGLFGPVVEKGEALLIADARHDQRLPASAHALVELEGMIIAPLQVRGGVLGLLVLINKRDDTVPGATFNRSDLEIVKALADQVASTLDIVRLHEENAEKQRMEQELAVAHDFQKLLLPRRNPELPEVAIAGFSQAALEVGGDYYDFIEVDDRHFGVIVGDVSGKGIPGALVMASLRSTLRANARGNHSPRAVLQAVNADLTRDTKESTFVSATYGIINLDTGMFRFARAGHEPLVCYRPEDGRLDLRDPEGMVLGMMEGEMFDLIQEDEVDLRQAGTVVLYTDGVSEAMNEDYEEYGTDRFHSVLAGVAHLEVAEVIEGLLGDIRQFTGGRPQHDDITLVVLRWRGKVRGEMEKTGGLAASAGDDSGHGTSVVA